MHPSKPKADASFINGTEAARRLGLPQPTFSGLIQRGKLVVRMKRIPGARPLYSVEDIERINREAMTTSGPRESA